jgi:hypothetical protein
MIFFKNKFSIFILILLSFLNISLNNANAAKPKEPILVVDKCPEFCPPGIQGPILVVDKCPKFCPKPSTPSKQTKLLKPPKSLTPPTPPIEVCNQVLIPVPNRPGYWYTNSCKNKIIGEPKIKNIRK